MTFFYDLNKKLAGIDKPAQQLNEGAVAEAGYSAKAARAGKDIGKPGKAFAQIAKSAGERYGSKERGEKVAGAVLAKLRAKESVEEGMTDDKTAAQQALQALGQGNNQDMIKDLQRRAGVPQTGKVEQAMAEDDMEEGNKFTGNLAKARAAGLKKADLDGDGDMEAVRNEGMMDKVGQGLKKAGKALGKAIVGPSDQELLSQLQDRMYPDLDKVGKAAMKPPATPKPMAKPNKPMEGAKPDYIDLDKDGNRKESMKKAAADAKAKKHHKEEELDEGWDDMMKDVERRSKQMKKGEKVQGHKGEIEKTDQGIKHTRRYDDKTGETDTGDDKPAGEKRGRGRPKKTDKAPERVTAKAYKHKGGRKMSKEEIEEAIAALEGHGYSISKLEEKAVSQQQQKFMGMVHAMQKGEKVKGASPELKKVAKTMKKSDAEDFAATKHKGLPKKKTEEVEETTVAGSVATSTEAPKSKGKGGMSFGKGIYDSMNRELESMIAESMNVSVNMTADDAGEPHKSITISAEGQEAEQLAQLLNLAGIAGKMHDEHEGEICPACGSADCGCDDQMVDENAPDWPTNTATTDQDDPRLELWSGGLNKPKETGQTTTPVVNRDPRRGSFGPAESSADLKETADLGMNLYKELKTFKAK